MWKICKQCFYCEAFYHISDFLYKRFAIQQLEQQHIDNEQSELSWNFIG